MINKLIPKPKNKFFFCSDVHGDVEALKIAMSESGFNAKNKKHVLVVVGDVFDRGADSALLYEMLSDLEEKKRAIVLAGNHDEFLLDFLTKGKSGLFNFIHNGLDTTVKSFLEEICDEDLLEDCAKNSSYTSLDYYYERIDMHTWETFRIKAGAAIRKQFPLLTKWLRERPKYLELENTVATHGKLDADDWRNPEDWNECLWASPMESANMENPTGKVLLVGHIHAKEIRKIINGDNFCMLPNNPYYREDEKIVYLDSCVTVTGYVNIVTIKDRYL